MAASQQFGVGSTPKLKGFLPYIHNPTRFHEDCLITFWIILLLEKRADAGENIFSLAGEK